MVSHVQFTKIHFSRYATRGKNTVWCYSLKKHLRTTRLYGKPLKIISITRSKLISPTTIRWDLFLQTVIHSICLNLHLVFGLILRLQHLTFFVVQSIRRSLNIWTKLEDFTMRDGVTQPIMPCLL